MSRKRYSIYVIILTILFGVSAYGAIAEDNPPTFDPLRGDALPLDPMVRSMLPRYPLADNVDVQPAGRARRFPAQHHIGYSLVAFQLWHGNQWNIAISQADGSDFHLLAFTDEQEIHPNLNYGANQLVYSVGNAEDGYDLMLALSNGSYKQRLTNDEFSNVFPKWSRDSRKIVFQSDRSGSADIFVMNADGTNLKQLTFNDAYDGQPTWSSDGKYIAFTSDRSGVYQIYTMSAVDGSDVTAVTDSSAHSLYPQWSPDGLRIAFSTDRDYDGWLELAHIRPDGTGFGSPRIPPEGRDYLASSWSPDSSHITYSELYYTLYQEQWYWVNAVASYVDVQSKSAYDLSPFQEVAMNATWGTQDNVRPTSRLEPNLNRFVSLPINFGWLASDSGGSGIGSFEVIRKFPFDDPWSLYSTIYSSETRRFQYSRSMAPGTEIGFRIRVRDRSGNYELVSANDEHVFVIDNIPPQPFFFDLPPYQRANKYAPAVGGIDVGGSGIKAYQLEFNIDDGDWRSIGQLLPLINTTPEAVLGRSVTYRVRATDGLGNRSDWADQTPSTILYKWGVSGRLYDHTGSPVLNGGASIEAAAYFSPSQNASGRYASYTLESAEQYSVTWSGENLGSLPLTVFDSPADARQDVYLPPKDNIWLNGQFESPLALSRSTSLDDDIYRAENRAFTGQYGLQLGQDRDPFEPAELLTAVSPNNFSSMQYIADENGDLHMVWVDNTLPYRGLMHQMRYADGTLSEVVNITPEGFSGANSSIQILLSNGRLHVAYYKSRPNYRFGIHHHSRNLDGSWTPVFAVTVDGSKAEFEMAAASNGLLHFFWPNTWDAHVATRQRTWNGNWSEPTAVVAFERPALPRLNNTQITVDSSNRVHYFWIESRFNQAPTMRHLIRDTNGSLHEIDTQGFDFQTSSIAYHETIVASDRGIHYFWVKGNDGVTLHYAYFDGQRWTSRAEFPNMSRTFELDDQDRLHLFLMRSDGTYNDPNRVRQFEYWIRLSDNRWYSQPVPTFDLNGYNELEERFMSPSLATVDDTVVLGFWATDVDQAPSSRMPAYAIREGDGEWSLPVYSWLHLAEPKQAMHHMLSADGTPHYFWYTADGLSSGIYETSALLSESYADILFSQEVTIPAEMANATLAYLFQVENAELKSERGLVVTLEHDGQLFTLNEHYRPASGRWAHAWASVAPWAGETVNITFRAKQGDSPPQVRVLLDDIALGTAYGNVWTQIVPRSLISGYPATIYVDYGNSGAADVTEGLLQVDLPPEIQFISANVQPQATSPLEFDLGSIPAGFAGAIELKVHVMSGLSQDDVLESRAVIGIAESELNVQDNIAVNETSIGLTVHLPITVRP